MDDTIIVYTGDQGFYLGEHDCIDKCWMYEESMRMLLLVPYPKMIEAGTTTDTSINNTDFAPTLIDWRAARLPITCKG